jgi:hypothetical protein
MVFRNAVIYGYHVESQRTKGFTVTDFSLNDGSRQGAGDRKTM